LTTVYAFFKNCTRILEDFLGPHAKSNTLMLSTKNVKFCRCSSLGHPVLWPWIRDPLLWKKFPVLFKTGAIW